MEFIIVLVIGGILASLSLLNFERLSEKNKGVEAEANLSLIYNAQKRYYLENGQYYSCAGPCDNIYEDLGIDITGSSFDYSISSSVSPITAFSATAARSGSGGLCSGEKMIITQEGNLPEKGCARW